MTKVLVTGATGFLGNYILKELEKPVYNDLGIEEIQLFVRTLSKAQDLSSKKYEYTIVEGDLLEHNSIRQAVRDVDIIFHVAALYDNSSSYDRFYQANVEATQVLMKSVNPDTKVILTSTYGVYGFTNEEYHITEDYIEQGEPFWHYQETKAEQEKTAFRIAEDRGIDIIAIRPPTFFGPGEKFFLPTFIESLESNNVFLLRKRDGIKGGNIIPFAHVEDVAYAHGLALLHIDEFAGEVYHMKSYEARFKNFVDQWTDVLNIDKVTMKIPYSLAYFIGFVGEYLPFMEGYSRFSVKFLGSHTLLDQSKIKKQLGYEPEWEMEKMIKQSADWYNEFKPEKRA